MLCNAAARQASFNDPVFVRYRPAMRGHCIGLLRVCICPKIGARQGNVGGDCHAFVSPAPICA